MNRSAYRMGLLAVGVISMLLLWGCGPSNPDQLSFRVTGFFTGDYDANSGICNLGNMVGVTGGTGTAVDLAYTPCFFVQFANNIEGTSQTSPNIALGNLVIEKVQAVAKIRETGKTLPTSTVFATTEVGAGDSCYYGVQVLSDEQLTALLSNEFSLPAFPFEIDISYTGFGRYAGSEYRATGHFTVVVTGLQPAAKA